MSSRQRRQSEPTRVGQTLRPTPSLAATVRACTPCLAVALLTSAASAVPAQQARAGSEFVPIGRGRISAVYDLDAAPPYAYALERQNLRVLDVRDPTHVREVANLEFEGPRVRSVLYGSHLYMVGFNQAIAVVDISDPRAPRWLGELSGVDRTIGAWIVGDVLWVLRDARSLTLEALDLRDEPGRPRRLAALDLEIDVTPWPRAIGVSHDGGRLFILVDARTAARNRIIVVDVNDPRAPTVERRIPLPEGRRFNDLEVRGDLCYLITRGPDGLAVFRLHGSDEPELLGSVTDPRLWYGADLVLRDDVIHASFKGRIILATFDVADPTRPKLVDSFVPEGWAAAGLGFSVADDRLYLSGDPGPSPIFDISEPRAPRYLGRWDYRGGWAADLLGLDGGAIAILNRWFGVYLYDLSNPRRPERLARHDHGASYERVSVAADDGRLLITYDSLPAELLDVSVPETPVVIGRLQPLRLVSAAALTSGQALLGYGEGGLEVIDLENPQARVEFELPGEVTDIVASDDRAVVACDDGTVAVIDLTDPAGPRILVSGDGDRETPETSGWRTAEAALSESGELAVTVHGEARTDSGTVILTVYDLGGEFGPRARGRLSLNREYAERFPIVVSDGEVLVALGRELARIDITDLRRPILTGRYRLRMSMAAEGLAWRGDLVYVGAAEDGLLVFELPD